VVPKVKIVKGMLIFMALMRFIKIIIYISYRRALADHSLVSNKKIFTFFKNKNN
jgi:hypothetical protein